MSVITIDPEKCHRDGICAAECPARLIVLENKETIPENIEGADDICINCGHCVAVCPHGALSLKTMSPDDCPEINRQQLLNPEQVEHFLRARRSIRKYKKKTVQKEILTRLIEIARFAPSGHNSQPVNWRVIYDRNDIDRLSAHVIDWMRHLLKENPEVAVPLHMDRTIEAWEGGIDTICRGAPHMIIAHALKDFPASPAACTIALTYLELAAPSFGLGACWAGYFNAASTVWPPMQEALKLPEGHISFGAMMIGYPQYRYYRMPLRNDPPITWQ
jgi:nitroreductase/NAD-dependent dihydropyrimidine dehydrogenase PreA subunit